MIEGSLSFLLKSMVRMYEEDGEKRGTGVHKLETGDGDKQRKVRSCGQYPGLVEHFGGFGKQRSKLELQ